MLRRILGLLGWLGVALVFAAVAIRFLKPEWQQWYSGLALEGWHQIADQRGSGAR